MSGFKEQKGAEEAQPTTHPIRITLVSRDVKALEKVCADFIKGAKDNNVETKGPVPLPTRRLRITTRKTPCGEGSKTWDRFQMRIHKRIIDISGSSDVIKQISSSGISAGVDVEFSINN